MTTYLEDEMTVATSADGNTRAIVMADYYGDRPDGDYLVPQVLMSWSRWGWNCNGLNIDPDTEARISDAAKRLDDTTFIRYVRAMHGGIVVSDTGYSQGDAYMVALLPTDEWYAVTGTTGISESDALDAISWARGDTWQVVIQSLQTWTNAATGETREEWQVEDYSGTQYATTLEDLDIPEL